MKKPTKKYEQEQGVELLFPRIAESQKDEAEMQVIEEQKVVDYEVREYTIELLIDKYVKNIEINENEIFIPPYQRKFIWDEERQSKFVESLLLGLPIPYMFLADKDGRSEIVDGSQRIRTLHYFLSNKLVLNGLKKLDKLNGFRFLDLPYSRQLRFKKKTVRLIELTEKATYEIRKEMFSRINTSSVNLTEMEIRRGAFEGKFMDFISECANNGTFHILCPISDQRKDKRESEEMILRFFAYTENYQKFVHSVKDFIDEYVQEKNDKGFNEIEMSEAFEDMLDFVGKFFPYGFKKSPNHMSTPRVRFEAISVGVGLALKVNPDLRPSTPILSWIESDDFREHVTSDAANNRNKFIGRIEFVKNKLLKNE